MNDETWIRILREAEAQTTAELQAADLAPLPVGDVVAWSDCQLGKTDSLSAVHRVGEPLGGNAMTLCGEVVPPAIRRMTLNPNLARTLGRCRYCESLYVRKESAA